MTIPYLMNCSHASEGWCLACVKEMGEDLAAAQADAERLRRAARAFLMKFRNCGSDEAKALWTAIDSTPMVEQKTAHPSVRCNFCGSTEENADLAGKRCNEVSYRTFDRIAGVVPDQCRGRYELIAPSSRSVMDQVTPQAEIARLRWEVETALYWLDRIANYPEDRVLTDRTPQLDMRAWARAARGAIRETREEVTPT